jgi:hypothetical protein
VRTQATYLSLDKEARIEVHAAVFGHIKFDHPATDAIWVELFVPGAIEGICEIDAPPVAADFHHLRSAIQRNIRLIGVRLPIGDAADAQRAGLLRVERIGDVILF